MTKEPKFLTNFRLKNQQFTAEEIASSNEIPFESSERSSQGESRLPLEAAKHPKRKTNGAVRLDVYPPRLPPAMDLPLSKGQGSDAGRGAVPARCSPGDNFTSIANRNETVCGRSATVAGYVVCKCANFIKLPVEMVQSEAFRQCEGRDIAVLLRFLLHYNGRNNGEIWVSIRDLMNEVGAGRSSILGSLGRLRALGFLIKTKEFPKRDRKADQYRLSWLSDLTGSDPTNDWKEAAPVRPLKRKVAKVKQKSVQ